MTRPGTMGFGAGEISINLTNAMYTVFFWLISYWIRTGANIDERAVGSFSQYKSQLEYHMLGGWGDEAALYEILNNDPVPVQKAYVPQALLLLLYYTSSRSK